MDLVKPRKVLDKLESAVEIKNYVNKIKIIKQLYTGGNITAKTIGQKVGISFPTVSLLLGGLLEEGLVVRQARGESQGGRKPDLYGLAEDSFFIVAIALDKFSAKVAIYNAKNQKVFPIQELKLVLDNSAKTIDHIHRFTVEVIRDSTVPSDKVIAIGLTMPGLVDSAAGISHTYLHIGSDTLKSRLEAKFGREVYIENDARAMALAEFKFAHLEAPNNMLGIFVGWGIGLGIIIDKKLYRGFSGLAGEFGHSPVFDSKEISCICGKKGCMETVASGTAAVRMAKESVLENPKTILARMANEKGRDQDPRWVVEAASAGDQEAIKILSDVGMDMGRGIAILIQLFNPELIVIGGVVAEAKNYILTPIQQALNIYSMAKLNEKTQIKFSALGNEVGLQGAVAIVNEHIFEDTIK